MKTPLIALMAAASLAFAEDVIPSLTIAGRTYTNATIRPIDSTTGVVMAGTTGAKINLAELPEPYRSRYYDEEIVNRMRAETAAAKAQAAAKATSDAAKKQAEAEAQKAREAAASLETQQPSFKNEHIEISQTTGKADRVGGMTISGVLKNLSSRERSRLVIRFGVYDEGGSKIDTATDFMSSLGAGESWKFEATTLTKVGKYSLEKVTCSAGRLD